MEEIKSCQGCKKDFKIAPEDFSFYEKVNVLNVKKIFILLMRKIDQRSYIVWFATKENSYKPSKGRASCLLELFMLD